MKVRTNEQHRFPEEIATTHRFTVAELPKMDFAARALHDAQAQYFKRYPEAKKWAHALIWEITPDGPTG